MRRKIAIPIAVALLVAGFGGTALAYFPAWGDPQQLAYPPYCWFGGQSIPWYYGKVGLYPGGWVALMPPRRLPFVDRLKAAVKALSEATGIPVEKLKEAWKKYPMPPRMFVRAVALSKLLNRDVKEVLKEFRKNPPLYLWESGIDPSQLIKKEWELLAKINPVLRKRRFRRFPLRGWGRRMMW
ncbi:MAG: hypothetical protein J7M13_09475 [Synergistetes bacterium]|nr:hypothetical protein [Synergistota bacterium]